MFQKINQLNPLLKIISVFICVTLIIGIAPTLVLSNLWVSAAEEPQYGTYTVSNDGKTLTAVPDEGAAFRGWYKNGKEVSYNSKITLSNGEKPSDYKPVFYNFNLANNPGFEDQNEAWQGTAVSATSNEQKKSGANSLKISGSSNKNYVYKSFSDLEAETQYTLSYYYKGNALSGFIVGGDTVSSSDFQSNVYIGKYLTKNNGVAVTGWTKAELTFYTKDNSTVSLLLSLPKNGTVYVDDICLIKDVMAEPTYFNEDFSNGVQNVFSSKINKTKNPYYTLSVDSKGRLKAKQNLTFGVVQFTPIKLKKGANYTISFNLDMSDSLLDEKYVPILNSSGNGYLYENGQIQYNSNPNWINFALTETEGSIGSKNGYNEWIIGPESATKGGNLFTATISDGNSSVTKRYSDGTDKSALGFSKSYLTEGNRNLNASNLTITMKVTAVKSCVAYLSACLNGRGTFYIDNINITEEANNVDSIDIVYDTAVNTLGTAIRTVGIQGIRHKTQIDKRLLTGENGYGIRLTEYGTVVIRTAVLGDEELVIDKKDYYYQNNNYQSAKGVAYSFKDGTDVVYEDAQTTIDFTGVLTNIAFEKWNENYTVRAYFKYVDKNGKEDIFYLEPSLVAVYPIAKAAYSNRNDDGEFTESDEVRSYLHENIISKFTDKTVTVSNNLEPIYNNFQGIRSTVYHGTMFFPDTKHGRTYTEEQAAVEMDRLADSKVDNVRTRLASQWMWEDAKGWNWKSEKMQAMYKWAKMLDERDISVTLNAGWHLHDFSFFYDSLVTPAANRKQYELKFFNSKTVAEGHSSIPEVNYLHGYQTPSPKYTEGQLEIICNEDGTIKSNAGLKYKYTALYGEDALAPKLIKIGKELNLFKLEDGTFDNSKYAYFSIAAARYAVWIKQALNAFKANGVTNVEYVLPFTETGYAITMGKDEEGNRIYKTDFNYDDWIFMVAALDYVLQDETSTTYGGAGCGGNIRNNYKIVGASQSYHKDENGTYGTNFISLIEHIYSKLNAAKNSNGKFSGNLEFLNTSPLVDINSMHCYPKPNTKSPVFTEKGYTNTAFDPYATYSNADINFSDYSSILTESGVRDMEFWCDEYFSGDPDATYYSNIGMQMTQFAAGLVAGINNGINRFSTWQMFDVLWDSSATHGDVITSGGQFAGGVHVCGTCPSLIFADGKTCNIAGCNCKKYDSRYYANGCDDPYVPRVTYYGINLIGKYMNNESADVFKTQVTNVSGNEEGGVYVSAIENDDGKTVVLVVNTMPTTSSVEVKFGKKYDTNFNRYTYDPNEVVPTKDSTSLPSDKTLTMEFSNSFYDIIPAQSFAIYVEE